MKSKVFSRGAVTDKFAKDIDTIASIDFGGRNLDVLAKSISRWVLASESRTEAEALDTLRQEWQLPPRQMEAVLSVGLFFLREMEQEDSIEDIVADLTTLDAVDPEKLGNLQQFVNGLLVEFKTTFASARLAVGTQKSGLKTVKGITCLVDLRPVVGNAMESGDDIKSYKPVIESLVPVIITRIRLSDDDLCVFQMDGKAVHAFQDSLAAAQKELDAAITFVGNEKVRLAEYNSENRETAGL